MNHCGNCGEFVTPAFVRVFGDQEGHVHGCPACLTSREIGEGIPARAGMH